MKSKATARGRVSIPSEIRKKFNIEPESRIDWIVDGNVIKVVPLPKNPVATFRGRGSSGKYSTERLVQERRLEREQEDEKDGSN